MTTDLLTTDPQSPLWRYILIFFKFKQQNMIIIKLSSDGSRIHTHTHTHTHPHTPTHTHWLMSHYWTREESIWSGLICRELVMRAHTCVCRGDWTTGGRIKTVCVLLVHYDKLIYLFLHCDSNLRAAPIRPSVTLCVRRLRENEILNWESSQTSFMEGSNAETLTFIIIG